MSVPEPTDLPPEGDGALHDASPGSAGTAAPPPSAAPPALSVAGAARGLGVAPATLRSWERRYGLAPSLHTAGGHRRYGPADLARLQVMHRLVRDGVPPAEAARVAIATPMVGDPTAPAAPAALAGPYGALLGGSALAEGPLPSGPADDSQAHAPGPGPAVLAGVSAGGGHVLPMPRRTPSTRGLARSAIALDSHSCHRAIEASLADRGALATWEELIRPVLVAVGEKWAQSGRGVEIEHSFSVVAAGALAAHAARLARPRNDRPVLMASVPDELHDLPLVALQAALSDAGIRGHVIGARTPAAALADAVRRLGPPVVFLWSQMGVHDVPALPPMRPAPSLLVGGPGWQDLADGVHHVADLDAAVTAVRSAMGL